jgi:FtsH-binding integral membrane protein
MDAYPYSLSEARARRGTLAGQVMGLLAFSMLFTAGGALLGPRLGALGLVLGLVGSIGCLIALYFARSKPGLNFALFYAFSVFEGMALGLIIDSYVSRGMSSVVMNAATTTAGLTFVLGSYAWTTKRDLSGMAGYLMAGLLAIIVAGLISVFFPMPTLFHLVLSAATAAIFSGFVMYDLQRLKYAEGGMQDAVWLAVSIYLDIFNLFLAILRIFGIFGSSDD